MAKYDLMSFNLHRFDSNLCHYFLIHFLHLANNELVKWCSCKSKIFIDKHQTPVLGATVNSVLCFSIEGKFKFIEVLIIYNSGKWFWKLLSSWKFSLPYHQNLRGPLAQYFDLLMWFEIKPNLYYSLWQNNSLNHKPTTSIPHMTCADNFQKILLCSTKCFIQCFLLNVGFISRN